jgi:hypothetical protein
MSHPDALVKQDAIVPLAIIMAPRMSAHDLFKQCLCRSPRDGLIMEFGVSSGNSLRALRQLVSRETPVYGFDSFEGLPEAWNGHAVGMYAATPPQIEGVELVIGMFEDTLPRFLAEHPGHVSFANIDCDLYSSTRTVLSLLRDRIVDGTTLFFDEMVGYEGWEQHEFRALDEFVNETGMKVHCLGWDGVYRVGVQLRMRA